MDFFEQANEHVKELNASERKIFEYVVRNINSVKSAPIRTLARQCFVSTTTIMRFTKKLGFSGYREFLDSLRITSNTTAKTQLPAVFWRQSYSEEYLKNIIESMRVITDGKVESFKRALLRSTHLYCFGVGLDQEVARFAYHLFTSLGYEASCPTSPFEIASALNRFKENDVAFLISFSGEDREVIEFAEHIRMKNNPVIATISSSVNNTLLSLSTIDFYVFADHMLFHNQDVSSRASMIAITEMLAYSLMKDSL